MIGSILFNLVFWPTFLVYLAIMNPIIRFCNQKQSFRIVYKVVTKWLLFCLRVFVGITYEIRGIEKLKKQIEKGEVIIGCNHQSTWETFIFSIIFDELAIVVKKELESVPIVGIFFKKLGCIPVDRDAGISSIRNLIKYGKIAIEKNQSILIFPNGTRSSAEEKISYKSGIFALYKTLNVPVVPCHVNSGEFWPRRSFKKIKGSIILEFKDAIAPGLSKDEFMKTFEEINN